MPIYEYRCEDCSSEQLKKLLSSFTAVKTNHETSGANSCLTGTCPFS